MVKCETCGTGASFGVPLLQCKKCNNIYCEKCSKGIGHRICPKCGGELKRTAGF